MQINGGHTATPANHQIQVLAQNLSFQSKEDLIRCVIEQDDLRAELTRQMALQGYQIIHTSQQTNTEEDDSLHFLDDNQQTVVH